MSEIEKIKNLIHQDLVEEAFELGQANDLDSIIQEIREKKNGYSYFLVRAKNDGKAIEEVDFISRFDDVSFGKMVEETYEATSVESDQYDSEYLLKSASLLIENKDFALARNIYQALLRRGLVLPKALLGMGIAFEGEGKPEEALKCYQESIAYSPEYPSYMHLAKLQIKLEKERDATEILLYASELPELVISEKFEIFKLLGNCFSRLGDYPRAELNYKKAFEIDSNSEILQVNVGSLALQKNDLASAEKHFLKALELNPKNPKAKSGLGMAYLMKNETSLAYGLFVSSLKDDIDSLSTIYNLIKCAYDLERFDETIELLRSFLSLHPNNSNIKYSLAGLLYQKGDLSAALGELNLLLDMNPAHGGARELREVVSTRLQQQANKKGE
ncbi:MAG: tetratricopeptide repeat protein [Bacteriovoracia bacterium]